MTFFLFILQDYQHMLIITMGAMTSAMMDICTMGATIDA
jgi:hypothetical protein